MDFKITIKLDLEKDAQNYRMALNKNIHPSKWKEQINEVKDFDFNNLIGIPEMESYSLMKTYLSNFRQNKEGLVHIKIKEMNKKFDEVKDILFTKMESLTNNKIYRNDFTIFLTSLNRGPYNFNAGYTWNYIYRNNFITLFIHELLHFQTIAYYKNYIIKKVKNEKLFEDIKESLTFLLNYEFKDIIDSIDYGYPQHQGLRKTLEEFRLKSPDKDFDKLIDYACDLVSTKENSFN